jgi:type II secretion system protein G
VEGFDDLIEITIYDDGSKAECMVDLNTAKLFSQPKGEEVQGVSGEQWMASKGIDAGCETNVASPGLWGMDMVVLPVSNAAWEKPNAAAIESELRDGKPGSPAIMSALGGLPRTFYFATREGAKGILQIAGQIKDERGEGYRVMYRLISQSMRLQDAKAQMALIETAMDCYEIDTGDPVSMKHGLQALLRCPEEFAHPEKWQGPYLKSPDGSIPVDPWGHAYRCVTISDGTRERSGVVSSGPDGKYGTADDLKPWDASKWKPVAGIAEVDSGVLEFRIAANKEEAETFNETGEGLAWYDSPMKPDSYLVTRKEGRQNQVLLWQTPEKSMTVSATGEKRWRVIEVSIMAEPGRAARIGVVFDEEGGRRLRNLTAGNIDRRLAMLVDGRVVSCPTVRGPLGSRVEITGNFSKADLTRLTATLQAGMETDSPSAPAAPAE